MAASKHATSIDVVKIFYDGKEEMLNVIATGESIVKAMTNPSPVCPLMGTDIKYLGKLGQGNWGAVFEIDFPGKGKHKYVVKAAADRVLVYYPPPNKNFLSLQKQFNIKAEKIINFNNLNLKPTDNLPSRGMYIPTFLESCSLSKAKSYLRFDMRGETVFNPKDSLCKMVNSEFALSVLMGDIYNKNKCIHFLNTFYFATCPTPGTSMVAQYTFMEKIDFSMRRRLGCIMEKPRDVAKYKSPTYTEDCVNSIVVQILYSIYAYQKLYKIVHGDLHDDNVFLEFVTSDTRWMDSSVLDADYYRYKIKVVNEEESSSTTILHVKGGRECPYIVKIGDWGMACKYSSPKICNKEVIETGYDNEDGDGPWLPNFYHEAYDVLFIMSILYRLNPNNKFIKRIVGFIQDIPPGFEDQTPDLDTGIVNPDNFRPYVTNLKPYDHVSPLAILTNRDVMQEFLEPIDASSKVVLLGDV
jgi:hypothetical protein